MHIFMISPAAINVGHFSTLFFSTIFIGIPLLICIFIRIHIKKTEYRKQGEEKEELYKPSTEDLSTLKEEMYEYMNSTNEENNGTQLLKEGDENGVNH